MGEQPPQIHLLRIDMKSNSLNSKLNSKDEQNILARYSIAHHSVDPPELGVGPPLSVRTSKITRQRFKAGDIVNIRQEAFRRCVHYLHTLIVE